MPADLHNELIRFFQLGYNQFYLLSAFKPISLPANSVIVHQHRFFTPQRLLLFIPAAGLSGTITFF